MIKKILQIPLTMNALFKEVVFRISPKMLLVIMAAIIFLVEAIVMIALSEMPPLPRELEALVDSTILLFLLTPFYLYIYKPFWEERQKQSDQIHFLSRQLIIATEEESKRIAHEIHDQCGQTLTALQFGIQTMKKYISESDQEVLFRADCIEEIASKLSEELREMTNRLRPAILDIAGLLPALNWQVDEFRKHYPGTSMNVTLLQKSDLPRPLDPLRENAIYRICQEALTNIARHASATEVLLSLAIEDGNLKLRIEDNGTGFNLADCLENSNGPCGAGVLGMRERALMVGGLFQLLSKPGEGTIVLASFPISSELNT